jgi:hypothetical protein
MAQKKQRSTLEKFRREQALREKRVRKQERKQAARAAKAAADLDTLPANTDEPAETRGERPEGG